MFDRFRALSVRQQIALVAAGVVATSILMGLIWYVFLRVPYRVLFTELRPAEAAAIVADLDRKKISYRLADGGATILVPADVADRTRLDVMTADVPLQGTVGFELFDKSDMGLTDFAQKINYQRALQGELERTIQTLDGVDSVRVHLSLGEDRIFRDDQVPPKASVTIRMQRGLTLSLSAAQGIQRLVAAAVPNLDAANVVILDEKGKIVGGEAAPPHNDLAAVPPADQEEQAIEQYYAARAQMALGRTDPFGAVRVSVLAVLNTPPDEAAFSNWSPVTRDFPLAITIAVPNTLDPAARESVRTLVANAVGYDAAKNDSIAFGVSAPDANIVPRPSRAIGQIPAMRPPAPAPEMDALQGMIVIAVFLALVASAGALIWLLLRPRRLSETRRTQLVTKFRDLLDQEQHDVVA